MENALKTSPGLTNEDIEQMEELYYSIVESDEMRTPKVDSEIPELISLEEDSQTKTVLSLIIQKCFEKIKSDRLALEHYQNILNEMKSQSDNLQEENIYLRGIRNDLLTKIDQLKIYLEQAEETNESLRTEISQLKKEINKLERSEEKRLQEEALNIKNSQINPKDPNLLPIFKPFQIEIGKQQLEIQKLKEMVNIQEQLIEKFEAESERYSTVETKHEKLKTELTALLERKNGSSQIDGKLAELSEELRAIKIPCSLPNASFHKSKTNSWSKVQNPFTCIDTDETHNRNFFLAKNLKLSASRRSSIKCKSSLAEDIMKTRMAQTHKHSLGSNPLDDLNDPWASLSKSEKIDSKRRARLLSNLKESQDIIVSDLDDQDLVKHNRTDSDNLFDKERDILGWLEGDISSDVSESDIGSRTSIDLRKSTNKIWRRRKRSKCKVEQDLETTNTATDRFGIKSSIDSNAEKKQDFIVHQEHTKYGTQNQIKSVIEEEIVNNLVENHVEHKNQQIKQVLKEPSEVINEYIKQEKAKAEKNTKFSLFKLASAFIFGS